jgi:hypothetical protein
MIEYSMEVVGLSIVLPYTNIHACIILYCRLPSYKI